MLPAPTTPVWMRVLPLALATCIAVAGWWATWFLCDDAFIAFRYVGNAYDGLGLVWNPPPFLPVEGYTSFLWVVLLYAVWLLTGIPPPQSANPLALLCGLGMLWLLARRLQDLPLPAGHERWRPWLATLVLGGIAANHSVVTWLSSGLETGLFSLLAVAWTLAATPVPQGQARVRLPRLCLLAALAMLTRPDGALLLLATFAIAAHAALRRDLGRGEILRCLLFAALPAAHFVWRRWYYGEWLPNTYHAKVVSAWPESGWRYLYCFAVEHGLWLWLPLAGVFAVVAGTRGGALRRLAGAGFPAAVAVGTWFAYVGYYTVVVGGDHFAYRVFAHLVPLLLLASLPMAVALRVPARALLVGLLLLAAATDGPGWVFERAMVGREPDAFFRAQSHVPGPLRSVLSTYDRCQAWLRLHAVGVRRASHAFYCELARRELPQRAAGQIEGARPGLRLVYRADAVGVVGWALRDVVIVDGHGLNDWVVARNPAPPPATTLDPAVLRASFPTFDTDGDRRLGPGEIEATAHLLAATGVLMRPPAWADLLLALSDRDGDGLDVDELGDAVAQMVEPRHMAHERLPPDGYLEALRANVSDAGGHRRVLPGVVPLTDDEVRAVERRYREQVRR